MASLINLWSEEEARVFFDGLERYKGILTEEALRKLVIDLGPTKTHNDIRILYNTLSEYTNNALVSFSAKMKPDSITFLQAMRLCWATSLRSAGCDLKSFQRALINDINRNNLLQPIELPKVRAPGTILPHSQPILQTPANHSLSCAQPVSTLPSPSTASMPAHAHHPFSPTASSSSTSLAVPVSSPLPSPSPSTSPSLAAFPTNAIVHLPSPSPAPFPTSSSAFSSSSFLTSSYSSSTPCQSPLPQVQHLTRASTAQPVSNREQVSRAKRDRPPSSPPSSTPPSSASLSSESLAPSLPPQNTKITLQLQPGDNADHQHVLSRKLASRLQLTLNKRKKLSFVVEHLIKKWGHPEGCPHLVLYPFPSTPKDFDGWTVDSKKLTLGQVLDGDVVKISYYYFAKIPEFPQKIALPMPILQFPSVSLTPPEPASSPPQTAPLSPLSLLCTPGLRLGPLPSPPTYFPPNILKRQRTFLTPLGPYFEDSMDGIYDGENSTSGYHHLSSSTDLFRTSS